MGGRKGVNLDAMEAGEEQGWIEEMNIINTIKMQKP